MAPDNEGWGEWGRYVLEELKRLNSCLVDLSKDVSALRKEKEDLRKERESRVSELEEDLESRLREAEKEIERLKERLKIAAIIQVSLTSIGSVVAGWIGVKTP